MHRTAKEQTLQHSGNKHQKLRQIVTITLSERVYFTGVILPVEVDTGKVGDGDNREDGLVGLMVVVCRTLEPIEALNNVVCSVWTPPAPAGAGCARVRAT